MQIHFFFSHIENPYWILPVMAYTGSRLVRTSESSEQTMKYIANKRKKAGKEKGRAKYPNLSTTPPLS